MLTTKFTETIHMSPPYETATGLKRRIIVSGTAIRVP
jgi:hypothetical protein